VDLGFLDLRKNAGGMRWSSRGKLMTSCGPSPPWIRTDAIITLGPPTSAHVMCGLRVDAAIIVMCLFDLAMMMELMQRHRITVALLMPPIVVVVVKMTDDQAAKHDMSSIRMVMFGAVPMGKDILGTVLFSAASSGGHSYALPLLEMLIWKGTHFYC
jgi:hypothetical protein